MPQQLLGETEVGRQPERGPPLRGRRASTRPDGHLEHNGLPGVRQLDQPVDEPVGQAVSPGRWTQVNGDHLTTVPWRGDRGCHLADHQVPSQCR